MKPRRHFRSKSSTYTAVCGYGYPWPSSIALTDDWKEVTCQDCQKVKAKKVDDVDNDARSD